MEEMRIPLGSDSSSILGAGMNGAETQIRCVPTPSQAAMVRQQMHAITIVTDNKPTRIIGLVQKGHEARADDR
jgi:hypothetical protein